MLILVNNGKEKIMIKNRLIYNKIHEFLIEYIGEEWLSENNIIITPYLKFNDNLNFDTFDEVIITLFVEEHFNLILPMDNSKWYHTLDDLVNYINDIIIERHFTTVWNPNMANFVYSGFNLVDEINALNPTAVLDIGCGKNEFKGKIHNLIGIDPVRPEADIQTSILDYDCDDLFDVVLVLGSINFGGEVYILQQLDKVISLCAPKGKIYFRVNPGISNPDSPWMDFFKWHKDLIVEYAEYYNLSVSEIREDYNNRLTFVYERR